MENRRYVPPEVKQKRRIQGAQMQAENQARHRDNFKIFKGWQGKDFFDNGQLRKPFPREGNIFERGRSK